MYALLAYILGLLTGIKNQPHRKPDAAASRQENPQSQPSPIVITYSHPPLSDEEIAENKKQKRREKFKSRLEVGGLVVLIIYTAFTGFIAWETKEATKATKIAADAATKAANTAQTQLEMSERPWVKAEIVSVGPITYDDQKRMKIQFAIKIKNIGHSPAINVNIFTTIKDRMFPSDPIEQQEKLCAGAKTIKPDQHWGRTLFPETDHTETFLHDFSRKEVVPDFPFPSMTRPKDGWEPNIIGCVDYIVAFSGEHHQTYFIYDLWGTSNSGGITQLIYGVNTTAEKIKFFTNSPFTIGAN